ncbi:MarR family transcriptional regulator [Streptomyces inhibens]|uniref:MarR family transcriptional regulator n=1 Tax=Streptomyces inhibens TaxID=2293571 RepID=A0A371PTJ8_STRIH|nr:MarR family transcriptional regulator [Streptomyces inhibens]REK85792.1 MarR family transcriptional regulator [Streptomyces inhibens]
MSEPQAPESRPSESRSPGPRPPEPRTPEPRTPELLSRTALAVFRLNGQFLSVAERLAQPAGLTAAWWQVLGAVLAEPLTVAGIARAMGITRQSVQRIADLLVERGLAAYRPNPAHRRAKLLAPTEEGRAAIARITPGHAEFAARLGGQLGGPEDFRQVVAALERLSDALEELSGARKEPPGIREEASGAPETPPAES